jgi:hypothetical protein
MTLYARQVQWLASGQQAHHVTRRRSAVAPFRCTLVGSPTHSISLTFEGTDEVTNCRI